MHDPVQIYLQLTGKATIQERDTGKGYFWGYRRRSSVIRFALWNPHQRDVA